MLEELDIIHKLQLQVDQDMKKAFLLSVDDMIKNNLEGCDLIFLNTGNQIPLEDNISFCSRHFALSKTSHCNYNFL